MDDQILELDRLVFNGVNGATGEYLLPEMSPLQVSALAQGESIEEALLAELKEKAFNLTNPHAGVEADARNLAETGWGLVLPSDADPAILDALQPLLRLRQEQAGERFKIFSGPDGCRSGESKNQFLERHGMGPGPVNPDKVPYYLLIAGQPSQVSYRFQYQLDVQYAVGRVAFDTVEDYARYALSVVQAESQPLLPPVAAFFGVANPDDRATQLSSGNLVQPLVQAVNAEMAAASARVSTGLPATNWQLQTLLGEQATKANLSAWMESPQPPALLFTASHGIAFPNGHAHQLPHQGALICQDWPGPQNWHSEISTDFYFSAEDLSSQANLLGSIAFFFACYGAGTPQMDEFAHQIWGNEPERKTIAPHDFVARLPQRMLSLPKGGALAVVGHVDRAWGVSFFWGKAGPQLQVYQDCFKRLMSSAYPIGYAMEVFNERYAEISSDLNSKIEDVKHFFKKPDDLEIARMWTANNDARNYILLGDPAVRLNVSSQPGQAASRLAIPAVDSVVGIASAPLEAPAGASPPVAAGPTPVTGPVGVEPGVDFGRLEGFRQAQAGLSSTLQDFVGKLGTFLSKALDESTSLEVATYVSPDMSGVRYENGRFTGAELRVLTRIEIDGDARICVPERDGEIDTTLWQVHLDMVQRAQASRGELLNTVVSAASSLVELLKP